MAMLQTFLQKAAIFVALSVVLVSALPKTGIQGKRSESLHPKYQIEWQADHGQRMIEFWISARTTGYVLFGLSDGRHIDGADMVLGGAMKNGTEYFMDCHGTIDSPARDFHHDWDVLSISKDSGKTRLHLKRKFETGDPNDVDITFGTTKLVWLIGNDDDLSYSEDLPQGSLSVNLLDPPLPEIDASEVQNFELHHSIYLPSYKRTYYWCEVHKRSSTQRSHITAFKPNLKSPEALKHVHHMNIYGCKPNKSEVPDPETFFNIAGTPGQECSEYDISEVMEKCNDDIFAWSLGGRSLVFPENVGFPWGLDTDEYFIVQYHLDNPVLLDVVIETGISIYHTDNLREHEAGILSMGLGTDAILIPPDSKNWTLPGYCTPGPDCTNNLPKHGIHLFNVNLHAHASASGMSLRHFRNSEEQERIAQDDTYDFHFQENRPLYPPSKVLPGDELRLDCTYDTTWKHPPGVVRGGSGSLDEMCMAFIYYYPRTSLNSCFSAPDLNLILIEQFPELYETGIYSHEFIWTDAIRSKLERELQKKENHIPSCFSGSYSPAEDLAPAHGKKKMHEGHAHKHGKKPTTKHSPQIVTAAPVQKDNQKPDVAIQNYQMTTRGPHLRHANHKIPTKPIQSEGAVVFYFYRLSPMATKLIGSISPIPISLFKYL